MVNNPIQLLEKMYTIRELERRVEELHKEGIIRGTDHFSTGQESIPVGLLSITSKKDIVTAGHRVHHVLIAQGLKPEKILSELMGKVTGYCKGYAGIMHISSKKDNFWGANGIVGSNIAISTGIALGLKQQKKKGIVITFFGDGSTTEGIFHETLNMASLWDLPILFVCENNLYAQSTSVNDHSSVPNITKRVKSSYNIDGIRTDGTDIKNVIEKGKVALENIRKNNKPFFLEFLTYRSCGHSLSDKDKIYFTDQYIKNLKRKDPIKKFENYLIKNKITTKEDLSKLKSKVKRNLEKSLKYANDSEYTKPKDLEGLI